MNVAWVLFGLAACYASGVTADNQRPFVVYRGGGDYPHGGYDGYGDYQRQLLFQIRGDYGHPVYGQAAYGWSGDDDDRSTRVYRSGRQFPEIWRAMSRLFINQPIYTPVQEPGYFPEYQPSVGEQ